MRYSIVDDLIVPSFLSDKPNFPFWIDDLSEFKKSVRKVVSYGPEMIYIAQLGGPYTPSELKEIFYL